MFGCQNKAIVIIGITIVFTFIFYFFSDKDDWIVNFEKPKKNLSLFDSWYFTMQSLTTLGYGDIIAYSPKIKMLVIIMMYMIIFHVFS